MNSKNQKKTKIKAKELEKLKEDEIIEILNEDLNLIKKIKNPSLKIQKMVVNKDVDYFKFIKTPDISIIEFVAKIKPSLLREDMFDIESVQNILIKNNPRYAKKFTKMSESIKEKVAKTIPNLLHPLCQEWVDKNIVNRIYICTEYNSDSNSNYISHLEESTDFIYDPGSLSKDSKMYEVYDRNTGFRYKKDICIYDGSNDAIVYYSDGCEYAAKKNEMISYEIE